jgi:FkbM family methyltransferase
MFYMKKIIFKMRFIRKIFRMFGWDINRYDHLSSTYVQLVRLFKELDVGSFIDIGANIGQFSEEIRQHGYSGNILSFEPIQACHTELVNKTNIDLNWIVAERSAIGGEDGLVKINVSHNRVSSSILPMTSTHTKAAENSYYMAEEAVRLNRLDTALESYSSVKPPYFLKIDVQGYEWNVLNGASNTISQTVGLIIELSLVELYSGQHLWIDIVLRLEKLGFTLWSVQRGFSDRKTGQLLQLDAIFLKK